MRNYLIGLVALATFGLGTANASVSYKYVADFSTYYGDIGNQVRVNLFLQETVTGASQSFIGLDGGLFGVGVIVSKINAGNAAIFGTGGDMKITPNLQQQGAGFGPTPTALTQSPTSASQSGIVEDADALNGPGGHGPMVGNLGAGVNKIFIGSLNITVGSVSTTYIIANYTPGFNTVTQAGRDLDINGPGYTGAANPSGGLYQFNVAAAPEPSSMALCGLVACGMGYVAKRRRNAGKLAATSVV